MRRIEVPFFEKLLAVLIIVGFVAPLAWAADEDEETSTWSRERRGKGTVVVKAREGSLPDDDREFAPSAVTATRDHYLLSPERLAALRAEAYVNPEMPAGYNLGSGANSSTAGMQSRAPAKQLNFDGLNRDTASFLGFGGSPPDTILAVSPSKILQATNISMSLMDRAGVEIDKTALDTFFGFQGNMTLFDPKAYFDRLSGRFFIVALELDTGIPNKSGIWLGVSKGSDPSQLTAPDEFCTYRIESRRDQSWADYPTIGINENWFAVSVNNFRFDDGFFRRTQIYVVAVDAITDNADDCPTLAFKRFAPQTDAENFPAFNVHPAQHYTTNTLPGTPLYLVSASVGAFFEPPVASSNYTLWQITTDNGGQPRLSKHLVEGDFALSVPPLAPQRTGKPLDSGDVRVTQVAFRDGVVWATNATGCAIGALPNESCVRAVQFTPSETSAEITFQETFGRLNMFLFWPGIAVNEAGDVVMAFQRSKQDTFMGISFNGKRAGATHFDGIANLRGGSCELRSPGLTVERTGDYVGLQTDPADNKAFWLAGEYVGNIGGATGCDWKTRIGRASY